jgi:hypothetical protein
MSTESTSRYGGSVLTGIADIDYRTKRNGKPVPLKEYPSAKRAGALFVDRNVPRPAKAG